jgi:hypothetical protein
MELEFSRQIIEKYLDIKLHENLSSGGRLIPCGQTDRQTDGDDEANSRFWQFCECAQNVQFKLYGIITSRVVLHGYETKRHRLRAFWGIRRIFGS